MERNRHKTSVEWPVAVDERLRLLVVLVEEAGNVGTTSASELLAALVSEQPIDADVLAESVVRYRRTPATDMSAVTRSHRAWTATPRRGRPRGSASATRP